MIGVGFGVVAVVVSVGVVAWLDAPPASRCSTSALRKPGEPSAAGVPLAFDAAAEPLAVGAAE